jgi:hypothetical protein
VNHHGHGYVEHLSLEAEGFRLVDATATGLRPHDDLVWIGCGAQDGKWITPDAALTLAAAITSVATDNLARRGKVPTADMTESRYP